MCPLPERAQSRRIAPPFLAIASFATLALVASITPAHAQAAAPTLPQQAAPIEIDGDMEVLVEDSAQGARVNHFLNVGNRRLRVQWSGEAPDLLTGTRVRVRGRLANETLELSSSGSVQTLALANAYTFGEQRTAVILINFQDNVSVPYAPSTAYQVTFGPVNEYYQANSYGQTWLTGEVFGWFTIPMSMSSCNYSQAATLADQAVTAAGYDLSQFARRVYAFPNSSGCSWWGLGSIGGNPSRAWINGSFALKVVAHELGHNFGDYHSNSQPCTVGSCTTSEYGDDRDMMGLTSTGHFTAYQKERLGWLNYGASPPVQTVAESGVYRLEAYGDGANGSPKALKILKSTDAYGRRTWYYVESRVQSGFDAGFAPGVTIHTGSEATGNSSYQIDLAPTTTAFDSLLDPGQVFDDPAIGLSIRTVSVDAGGAFVDITYPGVACTRAAPTVSMSPSSALAQPGSAVSLTVTVRNNDDPYSCSATEFRLDAAVPTGWTAAYALGSLTLAPGSTGSAVLTVTPAATAAGPSTVTAAVSRATTSGPGGSATATVNVSSSLTVLLAVANGYKISATVRAGDTPLVGVPVTFVVTNPLGAITSYTAITGSNGVATVQVRLKPKDPRGTYGVRVTASSGGMIGEATGSFAY